MEHQRAKPCGSPRCRHCLDRERGKVRPLTTDDLRWFFGEAESALGVRSTHGAFVDMAQSGPPTGGGGKSNGVENQAVEAWRLRATGRERCIRKRLEHAPQEHRRILETAYSPDDWTACHSQVGLRRGEAANPLTAPEVYAAARRAFGPEALRLAPLTPLALDHERRKQATPRRCEDAEVVYNAWEVVACDIETGEDVVLETGVRCVYRKPAASPAAKPAKKPADRNAPTADITRSALAALFARDPLLARSARGAVLMAACGAGDLSAAAIASQAAAMLQEARQAACVTEPEVRRPSVRRSRPVEVADDVG